MFHIKLTARPDARMVEVPLDIEVELPREFDGAAVLVSSGMPRKVKLRTPRDSIKLSTAYRIDQLVADLVRLILRGTPPDVGRVQEAATTYLKLSRERRQEGLVFLVESDGRGHIDVAEQLAPAPRPSSSSGSASGTPNAERSPINSTLTDRVAALERSLALLEGKFASFTQAEPNEKLVKVVGEQLERRLDARLADIDEHLAQLHRGEQPNKTLTRTSQALPTPGAARGSIRRTTAVEAFAEGLRSELKLRTKALLATSQERATAADKALQISSEAERLGGPKLDVIKELQRLSSETAARANAIARVIEEIDFYSAADVPLASQLVERLARGETQELAPLLRTVVDENARLRSLHISWLARAALLAGWKLIAPSPGDAFDAAVHEVEGLPGEVVDSVLQPGVQDKATSLNLRARVRLRAREDELPLLDPEPEGGAIVDSGPPLPEHPEESAPPADDGAKPLDAGAQPLDAGAQPLDAGAQPLDAGAQPLDAGAQPLIESKVPPPPPDTETPEPMPPVPPPPPDISGPIFSAPIISDPIPISGPISEPIIEEIISEKVIEEIISEKVISAPIVEDVTSFTIPDPPADPTGA